MFKTAARCIACAALLSFLFSCAPIPQPELSGDKMIATGTLPVAGKIPAEWGDLVAVTTVTPITYLWFQDEEGTVRLVSFNNDANQLRNNIRIFPRS